MYRVMLTASRHVASRRALYGTTDMYNKRGQYLRISYYLFYFYSVHTTPIHSNDTYYQQKKTTNEQYGSGTSTKS